MKLHQNLSIKKGPGTMTEFFPKIATVTLTLDLKFRTAKLVQDNVVLNICVKLYQNLLISYVIMTKFF